MSKAQSKRERLLNKALENIQEDRKNATELLEGVAAWIGSSGERYATSGLVAAKYLETLQRSNEQLVKIVSLMKKGSDDAETLSDKDKEELYNNIEDEIDVQ